MNYIRSFKGADMPDKSRSTGVWFQTDSSGTMIGIGDGVLFFKSPEEASIVLEELLRKIQLATPSNVVTNVKETQRFANRLISYLEDRYKPYFDGKEMFVRMKKEEVKGNNTIYIECDSDDMAANEETSKLGTITLKNDCFKVALPDFIKIGITESASSNI